MALRAMVLVGIRDSAVVKVASSWLVDVCFCIGLIGYTDS